MKAIYIVLVCIGVCVFSLSACKTIQGLNQIIPEPKVVNEVKKPLVTSEGLGVSRKDILTVPRGHSWKRALAFDLKISSPVDGRERVMGELKDEIGIAYIELIGPTDNVYKVTMMVEMSFMPDSYYVSDDDFMRMGILLQNTIPTLESAFSVLASNLIKSDSKFDSFFEADTIDLTYQDKIQIRLSRLKSLGMITMSIFPKKPF